MLWNSLLFSLALILATIASAGLCSKTDEQMMQSSITDTYGITPVEYHSNVPLVGNQTMINKHVADILTPLMPYIRNKRLALPPSPVTLFNSISLTITNTEDAGAVTPYPPHSTPSPPNLADLGSASSSANQAEFGAAPPNLNLADFSSAPSPPNLAEIGSTPSRILSKLNQLIHLFEYKYDLVTSAQIGPFTFSCRQDNGDLQILLKLPNGEFRRRSLPKLIEYEYHPLPGLWWFVKCISFETGASGLDITGIHQPGGDSGIDPNALKSLVG